MCPYQLALFPINFNFIDEKIFKQVTLKNYIGADNKLVKEETSEEKVINQIS